MDYGVLDKTILRKLFYDNRVGAKHLSFEDLQRGFPSHVKGDVKKQMKKLIKENLILHHPTSYGMQYSLNPQKLKEIIMIIHPE